MMREEPKHLKRGLKDISPLFQTTAKEPVSLTPSAASPRVPLQSLSLLCPEAPSNSLFFNASFASKMQSQGYDCALISVGDKNSKQKSQSFNSPVKRFLLSADQYEEICHSKSRSAENFGSSVFFFDFDYGNPILLEKMLPILDKWVLLVKPGQESMMEAYKYIKASLPLNANMEYFMVVNGMPSDPSSSQFFEKFSELVSRRLGVTLHWLGHFDPRFPMAVDGLILDNLQLASSADSIEKRAFAGFIYPSRVNG
jgi:hypothetical protein